MSEAKVVLPEGWRRPRGWSNGIGRGDQLQIAGQFGWDPTDQSFASTDFGDQWRRALDNVLAVVTAAGGQADSIDSLRIYVTDLGAYRAAGAAVAAGWQATLGAHFPTITMVQVVALTEADAVLEIEGTATV